MSDTDQEFGDGRFSIAHVGGKGMAKSYALFDKEKSSGIASDVTNWTDTPVFAYVIGEQSWQHIGRKYPLEFFLIHLPSNRLTRYKSLAEISPLHRSVFADLLKSKR